VNHKVGKRDDVRVCLTPCCLFVFGLLFLLSSSPPRVLVLFLVLSLVLILSARFVAQKTKQQAYLADLQHQIELKNQRKEREKQERIARERREAEEARNYQPWGRGGAGAPLRNADGSIRADIRCVDDEAPSTISSCSYHMWLQTYSVTRGVLVPTDHFCCSLCRIAFGTPAPPLFTVADPTAMARNLPSHM